MTDDAASLLARGRGLREKNNPEAALSAFEDAVKPDPGAAEAWYEIGVTCGQSRRAVCLDVKRGLKSEGYFLVAGMIGRNGHQRWLKALPRPSVLARVPQGI
jgi:tetratricopeptide (TPR) repeat protein